MTSFSGGLLSPLDGLDLLEQEGSYDAGLDAAAAEDSAVGSGDVLVLFSESFVVVGPELGNTVESLSALAAVVGGPGSVSSFGDVLDDYFGAGSPDLSDFVGLGVVAESASVGNSLDHLW